MSLVEGLVAVHLEQYRTSGVDLILGEAHFVGRKTVEVALNGGGTRWLAADRVFLNGGRTVVFK